MGYRELGLLRPDMVIFVDTSPEIARKLNLRKGEREYIKRKKRDIAESHWEHQKAAHREYKRTVEMYNWWVSVPGVANAEGDYSNKIHRDIWQLLQERFL
ncbi:hypothetical protein IID22_00855 [Patescibacteria group bacterium]|nr:hypothetical protein [Patescibacteria group bacterium]